MEVIKRIDDFKALLGRSTVRINGKTKPAGYVLYFQKGTRNFDKYTVYGIKTKREALSKAGPILKKIAAKYS